jgi:hypothetical protein
MTRALAAASAVVLGCATTDPRALEVPAASTEPRSLEQQELDRDGVEAFWQRRFEGEAIDARWSSFVESRIGAVVASDASVRRWSLHCRSTLCRLEVACLGADECSPRWNPPGLPPNPNLGAQYCPPRTDASGNHVKVLFLFREGRSMVPEATR